jgi:hypothetical protein
LISLIFSAYRRAKAKEDLQLAGIDAHLVLRMPLHGQYKSPVGMLKRFYGPVLGIERGYSQITGDRPHCLMMPRVHLPSISAGDVGEESIRLDGYRVHGQFAADVGPFMPVQRVQMLDQGPTLAYVENLKAAADCEYRQIARERLFHERRFQGVALSVRRFRFSLPCLTLELRIDIRSASQHQPSGIAERQRAVRFTHHRI